MRTKCSSCLCRTCLKTCCVKKNCTVKKTYCNDYSGFLQLSIFKQKSKEYSPYRYSWKHYGISKERHRQLTEYIRSGKYARAANEAARAANKIIAEYILLSVNKNLSYEGLEKMWAQGEIERIPCCRTDFYGIRRYFYHLFDMEIRRIGK